MHNHPAPEPDSPAASPGFNREEHLHLFMEAVEQSPVSVIITDRDTRILYVNPRFTQLSGYSPPEVAGRNPRLLKSGKTPPAAYRELWAHLNAGREWRGEFLNRKKSGELYWESAIITPIKNPGGDITHFIGLLEDITERKRAREIFEHLAYYDLLTDLPNQTLFDHRLTQALGQARSLRSMVGVILLDLDRFKIINETFGHRAGDHVIQQVGRRLLTQVGEDDLVARRGGDEFLILLPGLTHFREAVKAAQNLLEVFKMPFLCEGHEVHVTASAGIGLFPEDGQEGRPLLQSADSALYDAKDAGRNNFKFYKISTEHPAGERLAMENDLRRALDREEFRLYYQPQVSLKTGRITGMEALLRWEHPELGLLGPDHFVSLAEETGLIVPLGRWVLLTACRANRAWQLSGLDGLRVAVNLSARQFLEPELVEATLKIVEETGLPSDSLALELTESILMKDVNITIMILRWLNKKGIRIAIDDFGTGYSSLMYLKRFPINTLKIDHSFIQDCQRNPDSAALVAAIISLAKNLNLKVVAEGVENEDQLRFLARLECDEIQGYLFSPPVSAEGFERLLREDRRLPVPLPLP